MGYLACVLMDEQTLVNTHIYSFKSQWAWTIMWWNNDWDATTAKISYPPLQPYTMKVQSYATKRALLLIWERVCNPASLWGLALFQGLSTEGKPCEWCQYLQEKGPTNKRMILRPFLEHQSKYWSQTFECETKKSHYATLKLPVLWPWSYNYQKKPAAIASYNLYVLCQTHLDFPVWPRCTNMGLNKKLIPKMVDLLSRLAVVEMCFPWYFPAYKWCVNTQKKSLCATSDTTVALHV